MSAGVRTHVLGEEVFTTEQVANNLNISRQTVRRAIHLGRLKARKVGKQYLMTHRAVRAFYEGFRLVEGKDTNKAP